MLFGVSGKKKRYVDDVFHTFTRYTSDGNTTARRTFTNGLDNSTEGGLLWYKDRGGSGYHILRDTVRGKDKYLATHLENGEVNSTGQLESFDTDGFTYVSGAGALSNADTSHWNFRRSKGFFDIVGWSGNGTAGRQIAHNLDCVPGMIIVKKRSSGSNAHWNVYHTCTHGTSPHTHRLLLNSTSNRDGVGDGKWNSTKPTKTHFTVSDHTEVNASGETYIAYLFAGGFSSTSTGRTSVRMASGAHLEVASHADLGFGTGDFTIETWVSGDAWGTYSTIFDMDSGGLTMSVAGAMKIRKSVNSTVYISADKPPEKQWVHVAVARQSGKLRLFYDGVLQKEATCTENFSAGKLRIGKELNGYVEGQFSNFRVVKGTAVYTESFKVPTEPLTNITNTKLLCCNDSSSVTGSTVTPSTISTGGGTPEVYSLTGHQQTPFRDTDHFIFGENGDEDIVKHGFYWGTGTSDQTKIHLGWEPQWVFVKRITGGTSSWYCVDSQRGMFNAGLNDQTLNLDSNTSEFDLDYIEFHATGFTVTHSYDSLNANDDEYIYTAIRRPDGRVGKPIKVGTDAFATDTGNGSTTIPALDAPFAVDMSFYKETNNNSAHWSTATRMTGTKYLRLNTDDSQLSDSSFDWDSNVGVHHSSWLDSDIQGFMFKRHSGFDVVRYKGTGGLQMINHSLGRVPEMIWIKNATQTSAGNKSWVVGHHKLNNGSSPWGRRLYLSGSSSNNQEASTDLFGNGFQPTDRQFRVNWDGDNTTMSGEEFMAYLFCSIDGVSKVGSYSGSGSTGNAQNIGFQPRFLIIKRRDSTGDWMQFNSLGGFGNYMQLNSSQQQYSQTYVSVSATGFSLVSDYGDTNESGSNYIYYAHA